jgi:hypothetical protein
MSSLPQATGNALISCIHVAHTKYESNPLDWQQVVEIGWCLLTKQDMERFEEMCKDGLWGPGDYVFFEDWLAIDRSREGYLHLREGLVLEGEVQEMNNEENFYDEELYKARVCAFCWRTARCVPIVGCSFPSNRLGALLQVRGESGLGNVFSLLIDIF